jgi:hypothetical protein
MLLLAAATTVANVMTGRAEDSIVRDASRVEERRGEDCS